MHPHASPETDIIVANLPNHRLEKVISIMNDIGMVTMNVNHALDISVASCSMKNTIVDTNQASPIDKHVMFK